VSRGTWVHVPPSQLEISIYLRLLEASPQTPTWALPLDPAGGIRGPRPLLPALSCPKNRGVTVVQMMTLVCVSAVGDGNICFKEFQLIQAHCEAGRQRMLSQQSRDAEQRLRTAFKVFDIDGNGFIDAAELRATLAGFGSCVSLPDAEALLRSADKNGDGQIDYEGE